MSGKLVLIDDDVSLCETLRFMLTKEDYQVEVAHDGVSGLQIVYALDPDAVILDIMMPKMDGWQTCRRLREMSDVPILMLTAVDAGEQLVEGLNMGADDYVVKPVSFDILIARIRALLRRGSRSGGNGRASILTYEDLMIDMDKREVTLDNKRVDLSPTEFRLLAVLLRHKGRVLPHEYLLTEVWGPEYVSEIDYLRLYIRYLRRKVEKNPAKPSLIFSEWGVGYRLG
jgi:DNA-binding response OmpR family regulator